jgi:hypothetical protein
LSAQAQIPLNPQADLHQLGISKPAPVSAFSQPRADPRAANPDPSSTHNAQGPGQVVFLLQPLVKGLATVGISGYLSEIPKSSPDFLAHRPDAWGKRGKSLVDPKSGRKGVKAPKGRQRRRLKSL